jgi:hypothetical protein
MGYYPPFTSFYFGFDITGADGLSSEDQHALWALLELEPEQKASEENPFARDYFCFADESPNFHEEEDSNFAGVEIDACFDGCAATFVQAFDPSCYTDQPLIKALSKLLGEEPELHAVHHSNYK